jgi:uncharacterized protein (TIGR00299 family) protein
MKIAYLDTVGGIAGDMTLAAFVSAGLSIDDLTRELRKLPVSGFELHAEHVRRYAIDAVHIDVTVTQEPHLHRDLNGIRAMLDGSALAPAIKERAKAMFALIAMAEAKVHNTPIDQVHFHEVGALDSIVDITGAAICLELLGIERVYSSPVRLGSGGIVNTRHGPMPTPAPATLEILRDYPVILTAISEELTTPTGAAIIKALSSGVLDEERIRVEAVGYGAGTKEIAGLANFLRIVIGELDLPHDREDIVIVETNIDDMNPQLYPAIIEELLSAGAHDAYLSPIIMKKGRPGILLSVMVDRTRLERIAAIIYRQTSTIGLRIHQIGRRKLPRTLMEIQTSFGPVKAKAVVRDGKQIITPEFEECRRIANQTGRPLPEVMRQLDLEISAR